MSDCDTAFLYLHFARKTIKVKHNENIQTPVHQEEREKTFGMNGRRRFSNKNMCLNAAPICILLSCRTGSFSRLACLRDDVAFRFSAVLQYSILDLRTLTRRLVFFFVLV